MRAVMPIARPALAPVERVFVGGGVGLGGSVGVGRDVAVERRERGIVIAIEAGGEEVGEGENVDEDEEGADSVVVPKTADAVRVGSVAASTSFTMNIP